MSRDFIYHRVVPNMHGSVLHPLNELKKLYPEAYAEHVKKYVGREHLLTYRIPLLDCLWNDVIHFTAVAPQELAENLKQGGFDPSQIVWKQWFKVPVSSLDPAKTITCLYRRDKDTLPHERDFKPFDPALMNEYRKVPPETIDYYREQWALKQRPLLFHLVPHILYKGSLETKDFEIITME